MNKKIKRTLIWTVVIVLLLMCNITYTKGNKYTSINSLFVVIFTDTPLIEKGIIEYETE